MLIKYIKDKIKGYKEKKMMKEYSRVRNLLTFEEFFDLYNELN